ncbi:MAG: rubrerythrin family protein [Chloroflexi bacterium]|nr:rubrerythrin family protein [Chloroflexota bacterium]
MYKTEGNLQSAFAGESQAYHRYTFFANKAEEEGQLQVARLFRAAAEAEMVHARNHFNVMDGVGSTKDNLLAAATGEHYEITRVYPVFIEDARSERNERAWVTFEYANKAEHVHHRHFEKAFEAVKAGQKLDYEPYFVCQVCGNIMAGEAPEKCPICGAIPNKFKRMG